MPTWSRARATLFAASVIAVIVLAAGGIVLRAAGAEGSYRQVVTFSEVLSLILENYVDDPDTNDLMAGAYEGLLAGLDANGAYLDAEEVEAWNRELPEVSAGPGIVGLRAGGSLQIVFVAPGSSAEDAGLRPGDQIRTIDDKPVRGKSQRQMTKALLGAPGSKVRVSVIRPREGFRRDEMELTRAARKDEPFTLEVSGAVAVLTPRDPERLDPASVEQALSKAREAGADRLLLDLRLTSSGDVRVIRKLTGLFLGGELLHLKDRSGAIVETLSADGEGVAWKGPLGALVSGATAGSGEAIAELLRARRGSPVYGESTYGLGSEPRFFPLAGGDGLLIPTLVWEPIGGSSWERDGVEPDTVVRGEGRPEEVEADQLRKAMEEFALWRQPVPSERQAA